MSAEAAGDAATGARRAVPFALAVALFGIVFGALAGGSETFGFVPALAMSVTTFAGSAQFAAISVLVSGGQPVTAMLAAILLNLRYAPMGVSVAPYLRGSWWRRLLVAHLMVDESWALSARRGGGFEPRILVGAGIVLWAAWVGGTLLGLVGGEALGDPGRLGLDAAFAALFLALLMPRLRHRRDASVALLGCGLSLALVPFAPPGIPIVAASAAALVGLRAR